MSLRAGPPVLADREGVAPVAAQQESPPVTEPGGDRRAAALALLAYLLLAAVLFRKGLWSPTSRNIGNEFDTRYNMWALEWGPWAILHGQHPLFTDLLNFPDGVNMMWNTFMPLHGLLLWPVTATAGPVTSYNLLITLNVAFSAWCAFLALRVFVASRWAAFAGGLLYGFCPYMMAQSLDHPSLTAAYVPPLLLLLLRQILVRQEHSPLRMGALLGLLAAVQLFTAEEMLAAQVLVSVLGVVVLVVLNPRSVARRAGYACRALAFALAVFLLLTAWPLHFQFFGPQRITGGSVQPSNVFVSDVANLVVPTEVQALAPGRAVSMSKQWTGNESEWGSYLGIPLLVVLVFSAVRLRRRREVRFAAALALSILVLSFGPRLHVHRDDLAFPLPWAAMEKVPLLGHILPSRLMLYVFLLAAVLVAMLMDNLSPLRSWRGRALGAATCLVVAVSLLPDLSYPSTRMAVPAFFRDGSADMVPEGSVVLIAPFQQLFPADPMVWQAQAGFRFRMPQGYFFAPDRKGKPRYGVDFTGLTLAMRDIQLGSIPGELTAEERGLLYSDLAASEVQTVVVGPTRHQDEMVRFFTTLLGPPLQKFDDVYVWPRVHRLTR